MIFYPFFFPWGGGGGGGGLYMEWDMKVNEANHLYLLLLHNKVHWHTKLGS